MKDNKKIILSILIITALIIAIIGSTFAFFSSNGGSSNNAVGANSAVLADLGFTSLHSKIAYNLIPVASQNEYFSRYPGISPSGDHSCLDDLGNEICSIYEFTITNTDSVAQTIYVSFVPSENTFDNMYFAAFNTSIASANYEVATGSSGSGNNFSLIAQTTSGNATLGHTATKLTKNSTSPIDMPGLSTNLSAGASITYTVLVWLQETKNEQNNEQGGRFKAGITVTTGSNSTGVTGVMGGSESSVTTYLSYFNSSATIGQHIPYYIPYDTEPTYDSEADLPLYLKFKITNPTIETRWCIVGDNEMNSCRYGVSHTSLSSCEEYMQEDLQYYQEMNAQCQPKSLIIDGIVDEAYVEFIITETLASTNHGLHPGTYSLKGGDGGAAYTTNIEVMETAFDSTKCAYNIYSDPKPNYTCDFNAYRFVYADGEGSIDVGYGGLWCLISSNGESYCYSD